MFVVRSLYRQVVDMVCADIGKFLGSLCLLSKKNECACSSRVSAPALPLSHLLDDDVPNA